MLGVSAFSDRASEISLGTCPWASDISMSCIESESSFLYELTNVIFLIVMKKFYYTIVKARSQTCKRHIYT